MSESLSPDQRQQAVRLHHRKSLGEPLTDTEESLLTQFYQIADQEESMRLQPGRDRSEQRVAELDQQIQDMELLIARAGAFVQRLQTTLDEASQERQAIMQEKRRILRQTSAIPG